MGTRIAIACLLALALACAAEAGGGATAADAPAMAASAELQRPTTCAATGPCLEPWQSPVILRTHAKHELIVRGWGLGSGGAVKIDGKVVPTSAWRDDLVRVTLDDLAADDGALVVEVGGAASNALATVASPAITTVTPEDAGPGEAIQITGTGFGATVGRVHLAGDVEVDLAISSWTSTKIEAVLPDGVGSETLNGSYALTVVRRIEHEGRDLGELLVPPQRSIAVQAVLTSAACRVSRLQDCFLTGKGLGTQFTVTINGIAAKLDPITHAIRVPNGVPPGPFTLQVTTAAGVKTAPQPGFLLAWHKRPALPNEGAFLGVPGTWAATPQGALFLAHDVHQQRRYARRFVEHGNKPSDACQPLQPNSNDPVAEPVPLVVGADGAAYTVISASLLSIGQPLRPQLSRCAKGSDFKAGWTFLDQIEDPDQHTGTVGGLAVVGERVWLVLRDSTADQSRLATWTPTEKLHIVQTFAGQGALMQAGAEVYFGGATLPWSGELRRLQGGTLAPLTPPWSGAAPDGLLFETDPDGTLYVAMPATASGRAIKAWSPTTAAWTTRFALPADAGALRALRPMADGRDLVALVQPSPAGGDRLRVLRRKADGSGWDAVFEDLAEFPGCSAKVGRAALIVGPGQGPLAVFELRAPECPVQDGPFLAKDNVWTAELIEQ